MFCLKILVVVFLIMIFEGAVGVVFILLFDHFLVCRSGSRCCFGTVFYFMMLSPRYLVVIIILENCLVIYAPFQVKTLQSPMQSTAVFES